MADESVIIGEMVIGGEESDDALPIQFMQAEQTVNNRGRGTLIAGLDQHLRRRNAVNLIGVKSLLGSGQHEQSPPPGQQPGNPALCLLQEGFVANQGAKLLGSIVAGDSSS
jgi:hypothetical protein